MSINFHNYDLIEIVEAFAADNNLISSEEALSQRFDEEVAPAVIQQYGRDDQDAIDQAFNDWTDGLCKEGEIHTEQYMKYQYVGKYAE